MLGGTTVYEGETIYAWDPRSEQIVWWYWNTTGGHITGTIRAGDGGWISEGENHAPAGQTARVKGALREISEDSWDSVQFFDREGEWVEQWTMTYRPVPASKPADEKKLFIVRYTTGSNWIKDRPFGEQKHAKEHSQRLGQLREEGTILLGARYDDVGMIIVSAASENEARELIDADPAIEAGTFEYAISLFRPFFSGCVP